MGCQALRSPGTNTWLSVHAQGQQPVGRSVPSYCFLIPHWVTGGRNGTPPPPRPPPPQQWPAKYQASAPGVCLQISKAGQNKQFQPQPLKCPGYLSPTATMLKERKLASCAERLRATGHPSPSPFRASGLGRNRPYLTKSKWRRMGDGEGQEEPYYASLFNSLLHKTNCTHSFMVANAKSEMDSLRVTSGTWALRIRRLWSLGASSKQRRLEMSGATLPRLRYFLKQALYSKEW